MNKRMIDYNNRLNFVLQKGLRDAMKYEAIGEIDTAHAIIALTSRIVWHKLQVSGLSEALKEFWNDKKALIEREAL